VARFIENNAWETQWRQTKESDSIKAYKYLGVEKDLRNISIKINFKHRAQCKNKMQAIGSLAVPVLRYSFGIHNWH
jgi:hypothetical protein